MRVKAEMVYMWNVAKKKKEEKGEQLFKTTFQKLFLFLNANLILFITVLLLEKNLQFIVRNMNKCCWNTVEMYVRFTLLFL